MAANKTYKIFKKLRYELWLYYEVTLREKCPNMEFFLIQMRENTDQKKLRIWTHFTQCDIFNIGI